MSNWLQHPRRASQWDARILTTAQNKTVPCVWLFDVAEQVGDEGANPSTRHMRW